MKKYTGIWGHVYDLQQQNLAVETPDGDTFYIPRVDLEKIERIRSMESEALTHEQRVKDLRESIKDIYSGEL